MEPFKQVEDAQLFIVKTAYAHFRTTGEWPRARDMDLDYGEFLDPLGGLEVLCRQLGPDRIWCGSPAGEHDRVTVSLVGIRECEGAEESIREFLAAVSFAAGQYRERRGKDASVRTQDLVTGLGMDEVTARRALEMLAMGDSLVQGGGGGVWTLAHPVSKFAGVQTFDDYLARVAAQVERRQLLAHPSAGRRAQASQALKRIFLSHAAADGSLAHFLADTLRQGRSDLHVFVASRAGDIPTGEEWLSVIRTELRQADGYLLLLTPMSVDRHWLWYETGAAWMVERPLIPVTAAGLAKDEVAYPLGAHQALSLENPAEVSQLGRDLETSIPDPIRFCETVGELCKALPYAAGSPFAGIEFGGRYFAWGGPLHKLDGMDPVPEPPGICDALQAAGATPSFGRADRLRQSLAKGLVPVYETDKMTWKREVLYSEDGDQHLLVKPPHKTGASASAGNAS